MADIRNCISYDGTRVMVQSNIPSDVTPGSQDIIIRSHEVSLCDIELCYGVYSHNWLACNFFPHEEFAR